MTDKNLTDWALKEALKPQIDSELEAKFEKVVESTRAEYRIIQREIREAQVEYHAKIQGFSKPYRAKLDELAKELSEKSTAYALSIKGSFQERIENLKAKAALLSEESGISFGCCPDLSEAGINLVVSEYRDEEYPYTPTEEYFPTTLTKWGGVSKEVKYKHRQPYQLPDCIEIGAWYHSGICS